MAQPPVASANSKQRLTNPTPNDEGQAGKSTADDADGSRPRFGREAGSNSNDSDVDPSHVPVKYEASSDEEAQIESEDEDLRVFESKPSLPAARVEHRTLQEFMDLLEKEDVDLNPQYQRGVVWDQSRMVGLIDSIIENYYLPPVIFNRQIARDADGNGRIKRVCVDGKQRLSSVRAFMEGKIGCHDKRGGMWYFTAASANGTRAHRALPEHIKQQFRNRKLICYEYPNLKNIQEEDLFSRVQKGVQLTVVEKTRATTGPWQEFAKLYERDFPSVVALSTTKRSLGFQNVLVSFGQILEVYSCIADKVQPVFKTQAMVIKSLLNDTASYNPHNRDILRQAYVKFNELVETDPRTFRDNGYTHAKLFSPFEFVATVVLISLLKNWQDTEGLLSSIRGMRLALRRYLKDLRMNKDSWAVAWNYIEPMINQPRSRVPGFDGHIMESVDSERAHSVLAARLARVDRPVLRTIGSQNAPLSQPFPRSPAAPPLISRGSPILTAQLGNIHGLPSVPSKQTLDPAKNQQGGSSSQTRQIQLSRHLKRVAKIRSTVDAEPRGPAIKAPPLGLSLSESNGSNGLPHQQTDKNLIAKASTVSQPRALNRVGGNQVDDTTPKDTSNRRHQELPHLELGQNAGSSKAQLQQEAEAANSSKDVASKTPVTGIRKKPLARFTTSGMNTQGKDQPVPKDSPRFGNWQPILKPLSDEPPATTTQNASTEAMDLNGPLSLDQGAATEQQEPIGQTSQAKKRVSEMVIEISDEEGGEAAEELLARFQPHTSKRVKVKNENVEEA